MNTAAKMRNAITGLILAASLVACATSGTEANINKVSIGMTKQEVIAQLGPPSSTKAKKGVEYFVYQLPHGTSESGDRENDFFVRLTNGKVDSYGEVGDFDD